MKRPEKIIKWLHVESKDREPFVDYNGKPLREYFVSIPYWIIRAYKPFFVKVEIVAKHQSYRDMEVQTNRKEAWEYFKKNWSKKIGKMRKLNHNYMLVSTEAMGSGWFKSLEDYNKYHEELRVLNKKYLTDDLQLPSRQ